MFVSLAASMILAAAPEVAVDASVEPPAEPAPSETKWILRHKPRNHDLMISGFAGVLIPSSDFNLRGPTASDGSYDAAAADIGVRIGYYPVRFFGLEGEGVLIPTRYDDRGAVMYGVRAHGIIQAGWWRIVPFATLGGGFFAVSSADGAAGNDTDPMLHVGGGLKIHATKRLMVRVDVRDVIASNRSGSGVSHSPEALLSLGVRFGVAPKPKVEAAEVADEDGDGVVDAEDWCHKEAGPAENKGCPWRDSDCDGVHDGNDECPADAGVPPSGCAADDADGDGFSDADDACPDVAGIAPDGCPDPDPDHDGITGDADQCPNEKEVVNNFEDHDGCPDEVPEAVKKFTGVIAGITFATNKADIRPSSTKTLEEAARLLNEYPDIHLEIVGHTDDRGKRERNVELSKQRADSVKAFLVKKGVDGSRLKTRGAGPDEPRESNKTADGRSQNRRIEFSLIE